jgi:cell division protease FtsH
MVTEWGMSDKIGPLFYGSDQQEVFLGYSMGQQTRTVSNEMANVIDAEIKGLVQSAHEKAQKILTDNLDQLHAIAKALLEYETLSGDEIKAIMKGEAIRSKPEDGGVKKPTLVKSSLPSSRSKKTGTDDQPTA